MLFALNLEGHSYVCIPVLIAFGHHSFISVELFLSVINDGVNLGDVMFV